MAIAEETKAEVKAESPWLLSWEYSNGGYVAKSSQTYSGSSLWWRITLSRDSIGSFSLKESAEKLRDASSRTPPLFASFHLARDWAERAERRLRKQINPTTESQVESHASQSNGGDEEEPAVVIDGPVKLGKGFVGITADGRKATVVANCGKGLWNCSIEGLVIPHVYVTYREGGTVDAPNLYSPAPPRIVAPYPQEKPFVVDRPWVQTQFCVLDTSDGTINIGFYLNYHAGDKEHRLEVRTKRVVWFRDNGKGYGNAEQYRVLGPVAPKVEPQQEPPKLTEEIGEGLWWMVDRHGNRLKAKVAASGVGSGSWVAMWDEAGRTEAKAICDERTGSLEGSDLRLIRRVRPSTVEPYTSDEDKGRMFWKPIRRKRDSQELRVVSVQRWGVNLTGGLTADWAALAADYEHLDGSPYGHVTTDPWDA